MEPQLNDREKAAYLLGLRAGLEFVGGKPARRQQLVELSGLFRTSEHILTGGAFNPLHVYELRTWWDEHIDRRAAPVTS